MDLFANMVQAGKGVGWNSGVGMPFWPILGLAFLVIVAWSIFWKGMALWKAAREQHKVWFVVMLLVNTLGILEILYIYVFSKMKKVA
jgi:hypothetical protein